MRNGFLLSSIFILSSVAAFCQNMPVGSWRAHMPFNQVVTAATDGVTIYAGSEYSFFTYNAAQDELSTYSKVEGMSDVGISYIDYDATTGFTIIAYKNANVDLFRDETFYNIPDIKLRTIVGAKNINHIHSEGGLAYLSTSFGVVVLNLEKRETKETYSFVNNNLNIGVRSFTSAGGYFYAVTENGIYRAPRNSPALQAFSTWQLVDATPNFRDIISYNGKILVSQTDSLFQLNNGVMDLVYVSPYEITHLDSGKGGLWLSEYVPATYTGKAKLLNNSFQPVDSFHVMGKPEKTLLLSDESVWIADSFNGLCKRTGENETRFYMPSSPPGVGAYDILASNGEVWVAHGSVDDNWAYQYTRAGISRYKDGSWTTYNFSTVPALSEATDFIALAKDPIDGTLYAGAYRSGLFIIKPDGTQEYYKEGTSFLEPTAGDPTSYRVSGLAFDANGNLWLTQAGATHEIVARTRDGNWHKFMGAATGIYAASVVIDDYNQKWYLTPSAGNGIAVYDDRGTVENPADDVFMRVSTASVSSVALSLAKDKDGAIWIGTNDGIGIINCPGDFIQGNCQIDRPIVQYDQFAGFLFQNEQVKTIAVDGANRKWIGTTNGVWLISPDGDKIIYRFTVDNSPLPSNNIQKISIDPITGDVYIGTASGLVSYRSTATEGGGTQQSLVTYPNPVPSGYSGTISIRGLAENSDVRITDISGQLVFRTKALGGQAVWNGLDYTGKRPQSGVYLIFATNKDGSQAGTGKMVFME